MLGSVVGITFLGLGLLGWMSVSKGYALQRKTKIPWISFFPFFGKNASTAVSAAMKQTGHNIVMVNALAFKAVFVGDPDIVKFLLKEDVTVPKAPFIPSPTIRAMMGSGRTILHTNGDEWKKHREILGPSFHIDAVKGYTDAIVSSGLELIDYIERGQGVIEIALMMTKAAIDILGKTIFGYDFGALKDKPNPYLQAYFDMMEEFNNPLRLVLLSKIENIMAIPSNRKLHKADVLVSDLLHGIVKEKLKKRQKEEEEKANGTYDASRTQKYDIVDILIESQFNLEENKRFDDVELYGDIMIFFMAGHETTAGALAWVCIALSKNQEIQQKAFEEVDRVLQGRLPTFEDLKELTYLGMVIKEGMRYMVPVGQLPGRKVPQDTPIPGTDYVIPKGAAVMISLSHLHRDPAYWKDPDVFDPERFTPENSKGRHPFAYMPFSLGKRQCIGQQFSIVEQHIFLAMILQKYKIMPHGPVSSKRSFILNIPDHVKLSFEKRN